MTVATTGSASPWGEFAGAGQEEVTSADLRIPRLSINNKEGVFENSVTKEKTDTITAVVLGVYKQRVFFHPDSDVKIKFPICKSQDFISGWPSEVSDTKSEAYFFWEESGFNPQQHQDPDPSVGRVRLNCAECQLKEWRQVRGKNKPPLCTELHTYPMLLLDDSGNTSPALFSAKSSGIANSKDFISSFASSGRPFFTAVTQLGLKYYQRLDVEYYVPVFRPNLAEVHGDMEKWTFYNAQLQDIKNILQAPPRPDEDFVGASTEAKPSDNSWGQNPASAPQPAWANQGFAAPVANDGSMTIPGTAEPAAPAPAPAAPPPAAPTAPVAASAPPPPATTPAPVAAPPTAPAQPAAPLATPVAPAAASNDPLPF